MNISKGITEKEADNMKDKNFAGLSVRGLKAAEQN